MADFQSQAMGLTGLTIDASSTAPSRTEFSQFLNDGVIDVTNKIVKLSPRDMDDFLRESAETTSNASLDLNGAQIVTVVREDGVTSNNWRPCQKISPAQQYLVTDVNSLQFASKFFPKFMIGDNGTISVFPAPGADPNAFKVYYVNNSPEETDGTALDHASTGIKYFPNDKVYLVVLYAGIKSLQSALSAVDISTFSLTAVPPDVPSLSAISFSETNGLSITATAPTAISLATISYTDATNADASATAVGAITVATVGKADMDGNVPTYTKPSTTVTAVPPDVPTLATVSFSETNALSITASLPGTPSDPSISSPGISTVAKADISGDVPTYTKPGHPAQVSFSSYTSGLSETDPGTTVVTAVPPDSITDTITDFSLAGEFDDAMAKAKALIDTATMGGDTEPESAQFWLNDEDPEMVASTVQVASQELQRANLGLQDALQTFNTDMQKFQASGTGKFSAEVAAYQAEVGAQVQDYTQKLQQYQVELTTAYQAWAKTESDNLQVFQSDIQNELNEFNMENARYQANIQAEIAKFQVDAAEAQKEGDLEFQARIQDYTQELALFSGEIQKYQAEVNKEVQEYTTQLQSDIQTMQGTVANNQALLTKYQTEITEYQAEVATELQVIQIDVQNELNEFNKDNVRYQANVQAELAKHNTDLQKASTQAQIDAADAQQEAAQTTDVDKFNKAQDQALDLANRSKQIEDDISNNNSKVAQFQAEAQHYATQVNEDVQAYTSQLQIDVQQMQGDVVTEQNKLVKYQAELVEYQAEVAAETQAYQQEVAEKSTEYQWQTARLQDLKQEYDQAFAIMAPAPPPQAQQPQRRARR
jgi:hypothetical protein